MLGFNRYFVLMLIVVQLVVVTGCSNSTSASPPTVLGFIPSQAYIGVPYEDELGADGGDELLSYRISDGPNWLRLTSDNGAKPRFYIYGVPDLDSKDELQEFKGRTDQVILEVTDGEQTTTSRFEINVDPNAAEFSIDILAVNEGNINDPVDTERYDEKCEIPDMSPVSIDGKTAYPVPLEIRLPGEPALRTEISYALRSAYNEDKPELDSANRAKARPGVDYADIGGTVVFQPGVRRCVVAIYVFDDNRVEVDELFTVDLTGTLDGWASYSTIPVNLTIKDNEPKVQYPSANDVINEKPRVTYDDEGKYVSDDGSDVITYTLTMSETVDYPIDVTIFAKSPQTTAEEGTDFTVSIDDVVCDANSDLDVNTCIVTFPPGSDSETFKVTALDDGDNDGGEVFKTDDKIVIESDVSVTFQDSPINIQINEWIDDIEVGSSNTDDLSASMVVDRDGTAIVATVTGAANTMLDIKSYNRVGNIQDFTAAPANSRIETTNGKNILSAVSGHRGRTREEVVFACNTDGDIDEENKGFSDVYVRSYDRRIQVPEYEVKWSDTLATAGDDIALGVKISVAGNVYVYGSTTGTFDGQPVNAGGKDGFVAKYDFTGALLWISVLGSVGDDEITSIAFVDDAIVAAGTTNGQLGEAAFGGVDGFITRIDAEGKPLFKNQFGTAFDDQITDIQDVAQRYWVSGYGFGDFTIPDEGDFDPNGPGRSSVDVFSLNFFDLVGAFDRSIPLGDPVMNDISYTGTSSANQVFLGSSTAGEFEEGGKAGLALNDAVITSIDINEFRVGEVGWNSQFGTAGDDRIVDLSLLGDGKIYALWETINAGVTAFTVSILSSGTGDKLSTPAP